MESMCWWQALGSILQSFLTATAIVVGGIWTYVLFIRQRISFPSLQSSIAPHPVRIPNGWILHAAIELTNSGSVILRIPSAEIRLRTVVPLPDEVRDAVAGGYDPVPEGKTEIAWPMLAGRHWDWKATPIEIEPGERDTLHADFFVPNEVSVIEFYLYVANAKKRRSALGWTTTTIYVMPNGEASAMTDSDKQKHDVDDQQRQQKQQKPQPLQQRQQKPQKPQQPQQQTQPKRDKSQTGQQDKKE